MERYKVDNHISDPRNKQGQTGTFIKMLDPFTIMLKFDDGVIGIYDTSNVVQVHPNTIIEAIKAYRRKQKKRAVSTTTKMSPQQFIFIADLLFKEFIHYEITVTIPAENDEVSINIAMYKNNLRAEEIEV